MNKKRIALFIMIFMLGVSNFVYALPKNFSHSMRVPVTTSDSSKRLQTTIEGEVEYHVVSSTAISKGDQRILVPILESLKEIFGTDTFEWLEPWLEPYKYPDSKRTFVLMAKLRGRSDTIDRSLLRKGMVAPSLFAPTSESVPIESEKEFMDIANGLPTTIIERLILSISWEEGIRNQIITYILNFGRIPTLKEEIKLLLETTKGAEIAQLSENFLEQFPKDEKRLIDLLLSKYPDLKENFSSLLSRNVDVTSIPTKTLETILPLLRQYQSFDHNRRLYLEIKNLAMRKTSWDIKEGEIIAPLGMSELEPRELTDDFDDIDIFLGYDKTDPTTNLERLFYFISVNGNPYNPITDDWKERYREGNRYYFPDERASKERGDLIRYILNARFTPISKEMANWLKETGHIAIDKKALSSLTQEFEEATRLLQQKQKLLQEIKYYQSNL